jgi:Ca-activated chloride channel family protein
VLLYVWLLRRRKKHGAPGQRRDRQGGTGQGPGLAPPCAAAADAAGAGTLLLASARPTAVITLPLSQRTIMLAMDVSGSMRAEDVKPNRLVASQEAAKAFVNACRAT